jgi:hypothetical protein
MVKLYDLCVFFFFLWKEAVVNEHVMQSLGWLHVALILFI